MSDQWKQRLKAVWAWLCVRNMPRWVIPVSLIAGIALHAFFGD